MNIVFFSVIPLLEESVQEDFSTVPNHLITLRPTHQLIKDEHETSEEGHALLAEIYDI
jgi:hypothetical protein